MPSAIGRRWFIAGLGSAAAWPLVARAQQAERMRRIGFLWSAFPADDPEGQARGAAFIQGLEASGWRIGHNLRIDHRWGLSNGERLRRSAEELIALAPDVLFGAGGAATQALQQATGNIPIVFTNVPDPVASGYVDSLARPGGNLTGFMNIEYGQGGKWLELLKQLSPQVTRVAVFRTVVGVFGASQFAAIQAVAPLFGVEITPIGTRSEAEIERAVSEFARSPNGGLLAPFGADTARRNLFIRLADRHRLPAVYNNRIFIAEGGLISYGPDILDLYRRSASYVDRVLRGERPADLPVQAPTKYQTVINLKTAKALGLDIPASVFARADEVIE